MKQYWVGIIVAVLVGRKKSPIGPISLNASYKSLLLVYIYTFSTRIACISSLRVSGIMLITFRNLFSFGPPFLTFLQKAFKWGNSSSPSYNQTSNLTLVHPFQPYLQVFNRIHTIFTGRFRAEKEVARYIGSNRIIHHIFVDREYQHCYLYLLAEDCNILT